MASKLKIKLQLYLGEDIAFGPGKAELLRVIEDAGSISEAGKAMGMSYRRAWLLVDTMNRCFAKPLVVARPGRGKGSGAQLTEEGHAVLAAYAAMADAARGAVRAGGLDEIERRLRKRPLAKGK